MDAAEMTKLVDSEAKLLQIIENHISEEEENLNILKFKVLQIKNENYKANHKDNNYFLNPLIALPFARRFALDWSDIENFITNPSFLGSLQYYKNISNFPTKNILVDVAKSFLDLQNFYNLKASTMAEGEINRIYFNTSFTGVDCFEVGHVAYLNTDYVNAINWLEIGLIKSQKYNDTKIEYVILKLLVQSYTAIGDINAALKLSEKVSVLSPDDLNVRNDTEIFKKMIEENSTLLQYNRKKFLDQFQYIPKERMHQEMASEAYKDLCRKDYIRSPKILRSLHCHYVNNNISFLIIAPLKQEILNYEPFVCVYHDVIYDQEIDIITEKVAKILDTSIEYDSDSNKSVISQRRISKNAWIDLENLIGCDAFEERSNDLTGLIMKPNEGLQVVTYEIGGKYVPHFDYSPVPPFRRVATLIYYFNYVEQGGETVFPKIGVIVPPEKGTALFWYNSHTSGDLDVRSLHAGCPVLVGSKMIANFWIQEDLQIITRPCVQHQQK